MRRGGRRSADDALMAAGVALLALLVAAPGAVPWPRVRALLALFAFFYPIGEVARRALIPLFAADFLGRALIALSLGNAALALGVGAAWLTGNRLSAAGPIVAGLGGALVAAALLRGRRGGRGSLARQTGAQSSGAQPSGVQSPGEQPPGAQPATEVLAPRGGRTLAILLLAGVFLTLVPLLQFHDPLSPASDSLDHVGSLRKRIEQNAVFPRSTFYAVSMENGPDARKGLLHASLALVARSTRTPLLDLWDSLPFAGALWTLLAVFAAARALLPGVAVAALATLLFALSWDGGPSGAWLTRLGQPSRMMLAPYWTAWALILAPASRRPPLGLLAILGFGMAAIHTQAPVLLAAFGAFLAIFVALFGRGEARAALGGVVRGTIAIVAGAAPYLLLRAAVSMPLVDTIHTERQGILAWSDGVFLLNPFWLARSWGVLGLLAIPMSLLILKRARRDLPSAFLASGVLGTALLLANPLAMPLLYRALGYLSIRLVWFTPHVFLIAGLVGEAAARLARARAVASPAAPAGEARANRPAFGLAPASLLAAALLFVAASGQAAARRCLPGRPVPSGLAGQAAAFAAIDSAITDPSVILADPATGYAVPALTRHWTVSAMAQHTPPNDPEARTRLRDTRRILSPYVGARETVALLRHYGAGWILVNASPETALSHYIFVPGPAADALSREKFDARADLFTPVLDAGRLRLYKLTETALHDPLDGDDAPLRAVEPAARGADPAASAPVPSDPFVLLFGDVLTPEVARGGRIAIESNWERRAAVPEANRFLVVRLDRLDPSSAPERGPFAKVWRQARDSFHGERTRARIAFAPGQGFLPPDEWPIGPGIRDVSELDLPRDLAVGEYVVKIRAIEEAFYPNLRPEDLFSLSDSYDGVPIGTVRVTEQERQTS